MSKQLLAHDVTPEDRARGCIWASVFRSNADEVEKRGVITGAPVIDHGITFDGVNDFMTYDMNRQFADVDPWSSHCVFYPDFATNEDAARILYYSDVGVYGIWKRDNANANVLRINVGGAIIALIPEATYTGAWVTGGRNVITVSSTTGATDVWLNGVQILTANATAWVADDITQFSVGALVGGGLGRYDGRIEMLKIYNALLTAGEHASVWEGGGA